MISTKFKKSFKKSFKKFKKLFKFSTRKYNLLNTGKDINSLTLSLGKLTNDLINLSTNNVNMIDRDKKQTLSQSRPFHGPNDWETYQNKLSSTKMDIETTIKELKELGLSNKEIDRIMI